MPLIQVPILNRPTGWVNVDIAEIISVHLTSFKNNIPTRWLLATPFSPATLC